MRRTFWLFFFFGVAVLGAGIWFAVDYGQPNVGKWVNPPDQRSRGALERSLGQPWSDFPGVMRTELALLKDMAPERFATFSDGIQPYWLVHRRGLFAFASTKSFDAMRRATGNLRRLDDIRRRARGNFRSTASWRELSIETETLLKDIIAQSDRWQMFYNLGVLSYWGGRYAEALDNFKRALERLETDEFDEGVAVTRKRATEARTVSHYAIGMSQISLALGRTDDKGRAEAALGIGNLMRAIGQVKIFADLGRSRRSADGQENVTLPATEVRTRGIWNDLAVAFLLNEGVAVCARDGGGGVSILSGENCPSAADRQQDIRSILGASLSTALLSEGPFPPPAAQQISLAYAKFSLAPFLAESRSLAGEPLMRHNLGVILATTGRYGIARDYLVSRNSHLPERQNRKSEIFRRLVDVITYRYCPARSNSWKRVPRAQDGSPTRVLYDGFVGDGLIRSAAFSPMPSDHYDPDQVDALDHWLFFCAWRDLLGQKDIFGFLAAYKGLDDNPPLGGRLVDWKNDLVDSYLRRALASAEEHKLAGRDQESRMITDYTAALIRHTSLENWLSMIWENRTPPLLWLAGALLSAVAMVVFLFVLIFRFFRRRRLYRQVFRSDHHADRMEFQKRAKQSRLA